MLHLRGTLKTRNPERCPKSCRQSVAAKLPTWASIKSCCFDKPTFSSIQKHYTVVGIHSLIVLYFLKLQLQRKCGTPESQKWKVHMKMLERILFCFRTARMCHYIFVLFDIVSIWWQHTPMVGIPFLLVSLGVKRRREVYFPPPMKRLKPNKAFCLH